MEFSSTGDHHRDFWMVNNQQHWAIIPDGTLAGFTGDLPICLQTGTPGWGKIHIERNHGGWLQRQGTTVCDLLYKKLGQPGTFYSTEEDNKLKLVMRLSPDALLAFRHIRHYHLGDFLTIITMYRVPRHIDGSEIGRYLSEYRTCCE